MDGVESKIFFKKNEDILGLLPTLAVPSPALITPLAANNFLIDLHLMHLITYLEILPFVL